MHERARTQLTYLLVAVFVGIVATLAVWLSIGSNVSPETESKVQAALENTEGDIRAMADAARIDYPPKRVFFRAFKSELELEIWGSNSGEEPFVLIHTYPIARASGVLGPKRREGDLQVPEGVYYIDRFNPNSKFHLSLGLNYPNKSDAIRGDPDGPGTDIFIHGNRVSIGCLAMTDAKIEEIYALALGARDAGQIRIPVHIFPARFDSDGWQAIKDAHSKDLDSLAFWDEIRPIYDKFEATRRPPNVSISNDGSYSLSDEAD